VIAPDIRRLRTARLEGEPLQPALAAELQPLLNDPRVAATLAPDGRPPAPGGTPDQLRSQADHWDRHGFGLWLLRDSAGGVMIGRGGLQHTIRPGQDEVEIAWAIVPERWREGLATELALACVEIAFERLGLPDVIAYTLPTNVASRGVMEKIGMTFERTFTTRHGDIELNQVLYRRSRC
jgi:RimJ/RimL family protein N-acetyltransferase